MELPQAVCLSLVAPSHLPIQLQRPPLPEGDYQHTYCTQLQLRSEGAKSKASCLTLLEDVPC